MTKEIALLFSVLATIGTSLAQSPSLDTYNHERLRVNQRGLIVLGTWGAGNLVASGVLLHGSQGRDQSFYQMNMAWGAVNLTLAGLGIVSGRKRNTKGLSAYESVRAQHAVEQVFLVNAALDIAYVVGGVYLTERGKSRSTPALGDKLRGQGQAIVLQGACLFLFDGALYAIHHRHFNRTKTFWQRLEIADTGIGAKWKF